MKIVHFNLKITPSLVFLIWFSVTLVIWKKYYRARNTWHPGAGGHRHPGAGVALAPHPDATSGCRYPRPTVQSAICNAKQRSTASRKRQLIQSPARQATVTLNDIVGLAETFAASSINADVTGGGEDSATVQLLATAWPHELWKQQTVYTRCRLIGVQVDPYEVPAS
jgi:hypothetical protein